MNLRLLLLIPAVFLIRLPVFACWAMIPLETVVQENPLVVTGTIVKVKVNAGPETHDGSRLTDIGFIKVDAVLKNTLKDKDIKVGDRLPLQFPSKNSKVMMSTDIRYRKGQSGVWILEYRNNAFHATYPGDFQSADKEAEIKGIIAKEEKVFVSGSTAD